MLKAIRNLPLLEVLSVKDNCFSQTDFENFIYWHLKELKYLDYQYVYKNHETINDTGKYTLDSGTEEGKEKREVKEEEDDKLYRTLDLRFMDPYKSYDEKLYR